MVICDRYRFIYVGPPKTASTSLHHWLSQPALCPERWSPEGHDQHCVRIPAAVRHYQIIVSVRDPLDRCVSLWRQFMSPRSVAKLTECYAVDFAEFVRLQPGLPPFYRLSQSQWLSGLPRVDRVLRVERLAEDLAWLTVDGLEPLPRMNRTRKPVDQWTDELREIVGYRWRADLRYGQNT